MTSEASPKRSHQLKPNDQIFQLIIWHWKIFCNICYGKIKKISPNRCFLRFLHDVICLLWYGRKIVALPLKVAKKKIFQIIIPFVNSEAT